MPGCSIGHSAMVTQGTFGLLVKKAGAQGASPSFILSNSHVLALDGLAAMGDDVIQPGPGDVDGRSGKIAELTDWIPFDFTNSGFPNRVDAAIARVGPATSATRSACSTSFPVATSFQITEGMHIRKVGRAAI